MMKLSEIVVEGAIVPDLGSSVRDDIISALVDSLVSANAVSGSVRDELITRLLAREQKGSTGFGRGVAVPHVKHPGIERMSAAIGLSPGGIDFNALDNQPVYSVFLLLSPENQPEEHLQAMEAIFKSLSKDTFRRFLRQASSVEDVKTLLDETDNQQPAG